MDTHVRTPQDIFLQPQHLFVPPFQRPYVWDEDEQWAPLWQDVRRLADGRLEDRFAAPRHFLGAVVVQGREPVPGNLQSGNIIDGQQRLTTLQLLMDAAAAVLEEAGAEALSAQLNVLTHNQAMYVREDESSLKLRHSNRDQAAFDEVMSADPPIDHQGLRHAGSLVVRAHEYFSKVVHEWLGDFSAELFPTRAESLVQALTGGLQLVAINLSASEDSQAIFETLNARGTPLTASDLIKNFVFQRLAAERADTRKAYAEDWPFDTKFWEAQVSVGRYLVTRSSLFFNQWLVSRIGEEVSPKSTFTRFKRYVENETGQKAAELLKDIKRQATQYEGWTTAAAEPDRQLSRTEMTFYRMNASDVELLKPLALWLHSEERGTPSDVVDAVLGIAESWVVRRQLLRLTGSDLGRVVTDLIRANVSTSNAELPDRVRLHFMQLNVTSTYWPGDDEIRAFLRTEQVYRRFKRGRLRMLLEAIEDHYRDGTNQPQIARRGYPIEHILPQSWADTWPVEGLEAEQARAARVHRLGNLTLLTKSLNSKVSNGPWTVKRQALQQHDTLLMNSRVIASTNASPWNETHIDERTDAEIELLLKIWPVPAGHTGEVADPQARTTALVDIKQLVAAAVLAPGTELTPRPGKWPMRTALVRPDGLLEVEGKTFDSPSGAGRHVKGGATNGWYFWRLPDGRTLLDLRAAFTGKQSKKSAMAFDWTSLHIILERMPEGHWTSYSNLSDVVGTAPQPLGNHISSCPRCLNAHRVLKSDGSVAPNFAWTDPSDQRRPQDLLLDEGVPVRHGKADPSYLLSSEELAALLA